MITHRIVHGPAAVTLCLLPTLAACSPAKAQPPKTQTIVISNPKLTSAATRFQKAVTALSDSSKISIVAEGAPISFDETKLQSAAYTAAAPAAKVTLLADAADYDVKNSGGVFLLTKRYSNPEDLPCVTLGECRTAMRDISPLLNRLVPSQAQPRDPFSHSILTFFRSLSEEQVEAMEKGPLPVSQLTPVQRDKAAAMLASTFLDSIARSSDSTLLALNELPDVLLYKETMNNAVFLAWKEKKRPDVRRVLLGGFTQRGLATLPIPGKILPDAAPTTLGKEFTKLSEREKKDTAAAFAVYAAGIDYEEKPLTVAGLERLDAERAAAAMAGVYDLRLRSLGGTRTLSRRSLLANVTIFNVGDAVAAALPAPLTRLLRGKTEEKLVSAEQRNVLEGSLPGRLREQTVKLYADAAVQRLRQGHEREIDAAGSNGIPVADMDAMDRRAVTIAEMTRFLELASLVLNDPPPVYIEQFGQLAVRGNRYASPEDKKSKIQMDLLVPNHGQGGGYRVVAGYGNVPDDESP